MLVMKWEVHIALSVIIDSLSEEEFGIKSRKITLESSGLSFGATIGNVDCWKIFLNEDPEIDEY